MLFVVGYGFVYYYVWLLFEDVLFSCFVVSFGFYVFWVIFIVIVGFVGSMIFWFVGVVVVCGIGFIVVVFFVVLLFLDGVKWFLVEICK